MKHDRTHRGTSIYTSCFSRSNDLIFVKLVICGDIPKPTSIKTKTLPANPRNINCQVQPLENCVHLLLTVYGKTTKIHTT